MIEKVPTGKARPLTPRTLNRFIDADAAVQRMQRFGARPAPSQRESRSVVLARNETGVDLSLFGVLGIGDTIIEPKDNEASFRTRFAVKGVLPATTHLGRFVVLREPIAKGAIGRVYIAGVCPARVEIASESHTFADVKVGDATVLLSAAAGLARLLWVEPAIDRVPANTAWALIHVGGGSGLGTARFAVIASVAGAQPPYTYSASEATMDVDGVWTQVSGGASYNNVFNIEEQGDGGQWVNPLLINDVVTVFPAPDLAVDAWVCSRGHYRGTY